MCQGRSACPGRAAAHWGSACSSCFPDSKERKLLSSHPGMNLSAQWLLSWEVTGRTEGGRAVLSYKSVAEAALTRTVSKDTTGARMNRWNSVLDIHGGAFTPVLCGEMQYPPGAKRIGSGGSPPPYWWGSSGPGRFGHGQIRAIPSSGASWKLTCKDCCLPAGPWQAAVWDGSCSPGEVWVGEPVLWEGAVLPKPWERSCAAFPPQVKVQIPQVILQTYFLMQGTIPDFIFFSQFRASLPLLLLFHRQRKSSVKFQAVKKKCCCYRVHSLPPLVNPYAHALPFVWAELFSLEGAGSASFAVWLIRWQERKQEFLDRCKSVQTAPYSAAPDSRCRV